MLTVAGLVMVVAWPAVLVAAVLVLVGRRERQRDALVSRQVMVTDAIHRQLGAVVAPVVKRRGLGRGWRVEIAVPFEAPAVVGRIVAIAHAAMLRIDGHARVEIALAAQEPDGRRSNVRTLQPVTSSPRTRGEWENASWTGTNTSRAV